MSGWPKEVPCPCSDSIGGGETPPLTWKGQGAPQQRACIPRWEHCDDFAAYHKGSCFSEGCSTIPGPVNEGLGEEEASLILCLWTGCRQGCSRQMFLFLFFFKRQRTRKQNLPLVIYPHSHNQLLSFIIFYFPGPDASDSGEHMFGLGGGAHPCSVACRYRDGGGDSSVVHAFSSFLWGSRHAPVSPSKFYPPIIWET